MRFLISVSSGTDPRTMGLPLNDVQYLPGERFADDFEPPEDYNDYRDAVTAEVASLDELMAIAAVQKIVVLPKSWKAEQAGLDIPEIEVYDGYRE